MNSSRNSICYCPPAFLQRGKIQFNFDKERFKLALKNRRKHLFTYNFFSGHNTYSEDKKSLTEKKMLSNKNYLNAKDMYTFLNAFITAEEDWLTQLTLQAEYPNTT